jgi:HSP20 family protein
MNITLYRNPARALATWAPFYRPMGIFDDIDQMAREFWASWRPGFLSDSLIPHTDMYEEDGHLVIKTELPGITEKELEVLLEGDNLTIRAEKKEEVAEDATSHTRERYYGKYVRSMTLPFHVDGEKVSATLENGVLELRAPKTEEAKAKRIEVKAQLPEAKSKKRQRKPKQKSS